MPQKQTYNSCQYFGIRNLCPHRESEIMKEFISDTEIPQSSVPVLLDFSKEKEVNELCSSCNKFKSNYHLN